MDAAAIPTPAFVELRELYARLSAELAPFRRHCDARGICCNFAAYGHRLYVTTLEAAEMANAAVPADRALAAAGTCPFLKGNLCGVREYRALGCRMYFCDTTYDEQRNELYEKFLREIRVIEARHGIEPLYTQVTEVEFKR